MRSVKAHVSFSQLEAELSAGRQPLRPCIGSLVLCDTFVTDSTLQKLALVGALSHLRRIDLHQALALVVLLQPVNVFHSVSCFRFEHVHCVRHVPSIVRAGSGHRCPCH